MIKYDKLIRDNIPKIIEKSGKKCVVEVMDDDTYLRYLDKKLNEELAEYQADKSIEELADLLEVVYAAACIKIDAKAEGIKGIQLVETYHLIPDGVKSQHHITDYESGIISSK